jgi:hypothetical protein
LDQSGLTRMLPASFARYKEHAVTLSEEKFTLERG